MPTPDRLVSLPEDYQSLAEHLRQHISLAEQILRGLASRELDGAREKAIAYCIQHAVDLAKGCLATATEELPDSTTTLCRATLETLFWTRYVALSEENAVEFIGSYIHELKRTTRKNLKSGYARIIDRQTNEDKTSEFLGSEHMKGIHQRVTIEGAARLGDLERVYTNIYCYISMVAHGRALGMRPASESREELFASVSATLGALECIELITSDWIIDHKETSKEILELLLGI